MGEPLRALLPQTPQLEIFLPELVEAAQPRPLTELLQVLVSGKQIVIVVIAFFLVLFQQPSPLSGCRQNVPVGQIDEGRRNPQTLPRPQCGKLRRVVQKRVIASVMLLLLRNPGCGIMVGIIDGKGRSGVLMHHHRDQRVGVVRPLHQNHRRPQPLYGAGHMESAGRAVVPDGQQRYLSHFLAS